MPGHSCDLVWLTALFSQFSSDVEVDHVYAMRLFFTALLQHTLTPRIAVLAEFLIQRCFISSGSSADLRYRARASPQPDVPSTDNIAPVFHRHKERLALATDMKSCEIHRQRLDLKVSLRPCELRHCALRRLIKHLLGKALVREKRSTRHRLEPSTPRAPLIAGCLARFGRSGGVNQNHTTRRQF